MKKLIVFTLFVLAINIFAQNPEAVLNKNHKIDSSAVVIPDEFQKRTSQVITQMLTSYHYKKQVLNDSLSSKIFDEYIQNLDNNKLYFLKSDIDEFEIYRLQFDDFLKEGNLEIPFKIFNIYKGRLEERMKNVRKLLSSKFDFSVDESFVPDRKESPWAVSSEELDELWRLRVKSDILNLVLSGKDQKSSAEVILKRYQNFHKIILQYEAEDVFSLVVNSFTQVIDPHTDYFSPAASENFNIAMKLSLEGIGATLRSENDYTIVAGIVAGGPAFKSGLLQEEDRIIAVGQGEDGELVDIIGWRLDDAIQLIRGKKGTTVRLSVLKAKDGIDAAPQEIKIVREEVKLEDQAAKDEIINIRNEGIDYRYGVIKLPSFYTDWEGQRLGKPDYRSTTRDVKRILEKFKSENIDGVIQVKAQEILYLEDRVVIPDSTDATKSQVVNYNAAGDILDDKGNKTGNKIVLTSPGVPLLSAGKLTILDSNNAQVTNHKYTLAGVTVPVYSDKLTTLPFSNITKIF